VKAALLEALCNAWLRTHTANEIGCDDAKIQLLRSAAKDLDLNESDLAPIVQDVYSEVFLRPFSEVAATSN
jgi:hypothetical protein